MTTLKTSALELEVARLSHVVSKSGAKLDDTAEGVGLLMEMLDTTVTNAMMSEFESQMEQRLKDMEATHSRDILVLQRTLRTATDERSMLSARVRASEAKMEAVAEQERKREERVAAMESQVAGMSATVSLLRANAENMDRIVAQRLEDELQSFARSFRQSLVGVDAVVQGLDRKVNDSMLLVSDRLEVNTSSNGQMIAEFKTQVSELIRDAQNRTQGAEEELVRLAERLGFDQQTLYEQLTNDTTAHLQSLAATRTKVEDMTQNVARIEQALETRLTDYNELARELDAMKLQLASGIAIVDAPPLEPAAAPPPPPSETSTSAQEKLPLAVITEAAKMPEVTDGAVATPQASKGRGGRRSMSRRGSQTVIDSSPMPQQPSTAAAAATGGKSGTEPEPEQEPPPQQAPPPTRSGRRTMSRRGSQAAIG